MMLFKTNNSSVIPSILTLIHMLCGHWAIRAKQSLTHLLRLPLKLFSNNQRQEQ